MKHMPTLSWIGKDKVINHHRDVPFKVLEKKYSFPKGEAEKGGLSAEGNMIIHGDNLEALKALLPKYEGRVKCIYIDPPYNTGNEGWVYNDNVNDPKIKRWLHQVVGKEGEDLSRHDKWLCMMYPRLVLLHKLLAEDGSIWISIDDNEQANLKLILDEVFGQGNFIGNVIWRSADSSNNDAKTFSVDHNHTLVYAKAKGWQPYRLTRTDDDNAHYRNPDNDPRGDWFSGNVSSPNPRENLRYVVETPSGKKITPPKNGWRWSKERMQEMINREEVIFSEDETRIVKKTFLSEQVGITPSTNWWDVEETGHNRNAKYELLKVFPELSSSEVFSTPKPTKFLDKILRIAAASDSIILDSFAGSGTTAHAVLNLNKQDGGNRKFILVEMEDYAETITAERVKRVIKGYPSASLRAGGENKNKVEGTGGSFDYYTLGPRLFDEYHNLNEEVGAEKIREYVWFTETRMPLPKPKAKDPYLLGTHEGTAYYFAYEKERLTVLNHELLAQVKTKAGQYIIYADNCILPKSFLEKHGITFKKIPRDISRF
jgi:adenine-specific DNA-methyltransferase